jgi:hypothetical protein
MINEFYREDWRAAYALRREMLSLITARQQRPPTV